MPPINQREVHRRCWENQRVNPLQKGTGAVNDLLSIRTAGDILKNVRCSQR